MGFAKSKGHRLPQLPPKLESQRYPAFHSIAFSQPTRPAEHLEDFFRVYSQGEVSNPAGQLPPDW